MMNETTRTPGSGPITTKPDFQRPLARHITIRKVRVLASRVPAHKTGNVHTSNPHTNELDWDC